MAKGQFSLSLARFAEQTGRNIDEVMRQSVYALLNAILLRSPVDTGRFRGNWNTSIGVPNLTVENKTYPGGSIESRGAAASQESLDEAQKVLATFQGDGVLYLSNGLIYGQELEYHAHSKQAPNGFVRLALREYRRYLQRAIDALPR